MVSAAEQLARNINFSTFGKAKELQARLWFTLGALVVYRLGTHIVIPGIDSAQYAQAFGNAANGCTPDYQGMVVAALAKDPDIMKRSGGTFISAEVGHGALDANASADGVEVIDHDVVCNGRSVNSV